MGQRMIQFERHSPQAMSRQPGRRGDGCMDGPSARRRGNNLKYLSLAFLAVAGMVAMCIMPADALAAEMSRRPNIVVILGDDLGFADLGSYGSEIKTPNIDSLADRTACASPTFYTHATCSPTRSLLLSGVDTHQNGLGNMDEWTAPNQQGVPEGYEGYHQRPGGHPPPAAQGCRLPHLHGRQVAPGQAARPDTRARAASSAIFRCSTGRAATGT